MGSAEIDYNVSVGLLSRSGLREQEEFNRLIRIWCENLPKLKPVRWGWYEPFQNRFAFPDLPDFRKPSHEDCDAIFLYGSHDDRLNIFLAPKPLKLPMHSSLQVHFRHDPSQGQDESLVKFMQTAARDFNVDFGFIELPTRDYLKTVPQPASVTERFVVEEQFREGDPLNLRLTTNFLVNGVPDLFWITLLGLPYVELLGEERIRSAPAHRVEKLQDGSYLLQLTEHLGDCISKPKYLQSRRKAVKQHLGESAFGYGEMWEDEPRLVPTFHLADGDIRTPGSTPWDNPRHPPMPVDELIEKFKKLSEL